MNKVIVEREVLHQIARNASGSGERGLPTSMLQKMASAARHIADATAVQENGPLEIVVTE